MAGENETINFNQDDKTEAVTGGMFSEHDCKYGASNDGQQYAVCLLENQKRGREEMSKDYTCVNCKYCEEADYSRFFCCVNPPQYPNDLSLDPSDPHSWNDPAVFPDRKACRFYKAKIYENEGDEK